MSKSTPNGRGDDSTLLTSQVTSVIFVAGVHGAGKTTFSRKLSEALGFQNFSAGNLIRAQRKQEEAADKRVKDVDTNQDELAKALANLDLRAPYIVLDGHFCVLDTVGGICAIPLATDIGLKLKLVVILTDSPEQIRDQLLSRDGRAQSCEEIRR